MHGRSFRVFYIAGIATVFAAACQSPQEPAPEWTALPFLLSVDHHRLASALR